MTSFFKDHIVGMVVFAIITGIIANYAYEKMEYKAPSHNLIEIRSIQTRERFDDVIAIVNAMVNQGELSSTCVQEQPQKWEILDVASYDLNNIILPKNWTWIFSGC